jgi:hypothetical protein
MNMTTAVNIYVKLTQDGEEAMKKLETRCSVLVFQFPLEGAKSGIRSKIVNLQKVLPRDAVREFWRRGGGLKPPLVRGR